MVHFRGVGAVLPSGPPRVEASWGPHRPAWRGGTCPREGAAHFPRLSTLLPAACGHQRARQDRGRRSVPSPLVCAHLVPEVAPWPLWQIQKAALKGFLGRAHRTLQAGQSAPCRCISTLDVQATLEPRAQLPGDPQLLLSSPVGPLGPVTGQRLAGRDTGWPQSLSLGPPCPSRCFPGVTLVSLGVSCNAPTFSLPGSGVWDQDFAERSGSVSRHLSLQSQPRR